MRKYFILLCMIGMPLQMAMPTVMADESNELTIIAVGAGDSDAQNKPMSGWSFNVYQVNNDAQLDQLNQLNENRLKAQAIKSYETNPTNEAGATTLSQLPQGLYYVRQMPKTAQKHQKSVPFLVLLPDIKGNKHVTVYPKIMIERGSVTLLKYTTKDNQSVPLAGAVFELYDANGTTPLRVKDEQLTTDMSALTRLTTNKAGEITVSNLTPGRYYFKEIQAPKGYKLDDRPLWFTVQSAERVYVSHENHLMPPPDKPNEPKKPNTPPWLPQTGESLLMIGVGVLLIGIGIKLGRSTKSEGSIG